MAFTGFRPAAWEFFRGLKRNNRREWFEARRETYEEEVRAPLRELLGELDVRLATLVPELEADPRKSVFRIHRDIRFSKDKSPYKTNAGFWINHRGLGRSAAAVVHGGAGLYFHFEPRASMIAAGIWMPPQPALVRIRSAIADDVRGWEDTLRRMKRQFGTLSQEAVLQRVPRGYSPDHPAAAWLRYKSFTVSRPLTAEDLKSGDLPDRLARSYGAVIPFVRWLNSALGFPPARRR